MFDSYSRTVSGLDVFPPGQGDAFEGGWLEHFEIPGAHLMLPIMRARRIFAESSLDRYDGGLRAGRLDPRALGRRAWSGDDRLFRRRVRAEGIDFEVVIGLDISASTEFAPERLAMIRQAGEGLCGVLSRIGVQCSMYAHTAVQDSGGWRQQIYTVKGRSEMWTTTVRARIGQLRSIVGSLDGHNLEFYRKALDRSPARGRLIVYFTDGVIPEQNTAEEREIILREAEICRQRGYSLMAVGVQNDSPKNFGFDTVRLDSGDDIVTVLNELESRITSKDSVNRKR